MDKTAVVRLLAVCFAIGVPWHSNLCYANASQSSKSIDSSIDPKYVFSRLNRETLPKYSQDSGFWSFAVCIPNVISRSGQPSMIDFRWLKDHGWKGIVNLQTTSDAKWPGFKELNFNYLALPINDNSAPSDKQAQEFLEFVTSPYNQPVHIYCHAGAGRTGVMIALYRYMVQGWPMFIAIIESRFFGSGINDVQENWLKSWAKAHKPGSFSKQSKKSKPIENNHHSN
jgi:protein tyrosine/serine phosphatase